ncbi:MAG: hypothetical protein ABIO40_02760 [Devosia sp.]
MTDPARPRDCIIMLTHRWDARLAKHYARLKREAGKIAPVFLAYQLCDTMDPPNDVPFDTLVRLADSASLFPARHAAHAARGSATVKGYVDLIWLSVFLQPKFADFDRFWLVEYDVDFSGDWALFFGEAARFEGDLLVSHLRTRQNHLDWNILRKVTDPLDSPGDHLIGFMPVSRFTRPLVDYFQRELSVQRWRGHFELILPTLARRGGFVVSDWGGSGEFTPASRRDRFYEGDFTAGGRGFYTHGYKPPRAQHYFVESRFGFWATNKIYHPIKTNYPPLGKILRWGQLVRDRLRLRLAHMLGREPRLKGPR